MGISSPYSVTGAATIPPQGSNLTGTVTVATGQLNKLVGSSTKFTTELAVHKCIHVDGEVRRIRAIASDTLLYVTEPFASTHAGKVYQRLNDWMPEMISIFNSHASAAITINGVSFPAGSTFNREFSQEPIVLDATGASAIIELSDMTR